MFSFGTAFYLKVFPLFCLPPVNMYTLLRIILKYDQLFFKKRTLKMKYWPAAHLFIYNGNMTKKKIITLLISF